MEMDASLSSSQQERPIRFELVDDESTRTLVYSIDAAYQSFMMAVSGPTTLLPDAHGDRSTEAPHALFSLASRPSRVPHFIASPFKLHAMHMTGASSLSPDKAIEHLKNIVQCARQAILPNSKSLVDHPSGEYQNTQQLPEISPAVRASPFLGGYASGYNLTGNKHGSTRHVRSTGGKFAGMRDLGTMVSGDFSDPGTPGWAGRESVAPSPHPDIEEHEHLYRLRSHDPDSDDEDADGIGTVINGYMIVGELGTGSFGRVVLAVHSETDEVVAIKIVRRSLLNRERRYAVTNHKHVFAASTTSEPAAPPAVQAAPASQHIIRKEIAVMKRLRHRHLVALRAVVDDPSADRLYLIMQYIPHGPFLPTLSGTSSMRVDPLPEKTARAYARQLISALRHLHANNIVHRDVKPENILKGDEDRIYLADFGVSEIVDDLKLNRNVVGTRGTPSFWSPEMFDEKETTVDGVRQDEWALAVTIYLMLVGRLPFEARSLQDLAFSVRNDPVLIPDTLSPEARDFLRRALMKNKSDRLSLSEMREHHFVRGHVSRQRRNLENARAAAGRIHGGGEKGGAATPVLASLKDDSAILEAAVVEAAVVRPTLLVVNTPGQGSSPLETSSSTPPHLDLSRNPGDKPAPANNNSHLTVKSSFRHLSAAVAANGQLLTPNSSRVVARLALRERPLPPEEDAWERDSLSGDEDNAEEDSGGSADFGAAYSEPSPPRERRASVGRASTMQYKKSPRAILPGPLMENNNNDAANHSTGSSEETQTPLQRVGSYSVTTSLKQEAEIARRRKAAS